MLGCPSNSKAGLGFRVEGFDSHARTRRHGFNTIQHSYRRSCYSATNQPRATANHKINHIKSEDRRNAPACSRVKSRNRWRTRQKNSHVTRGSSRLVSTTAPKSYGKTPSTLRQNQSQPNLGLHEQHEQRGSQYKTRLHRISSSSGIPPARS